ncbi:MAG TPA: LysE family translocator [Candidatus Dietzia merdigallinarum]|nr:LysE family translocator [Candidatus Dietzia merdigallinarum]
MTAIDALLGFAVVAGLLTLVPGIDTALVIRSSLTRARVYAWATAAGIATGAMAWGIAAAVGVSALLTASEAAYRVLTIAGAAYMAYLGGALIWRSIHEHPAELSEPASAASPDSSLVQGYLIGVGTNLLNPKVGVFYIATIPQFLPADAAPVAMGAALAGVHGLLTLAWFGLLITAGSLARRWLANPRNLVTIDRVTGLVLIVFAGRLLVDSLSAHLTALPATARAALA